MDSMTLPGAKPLSVVSTGAAFPHIWTWSVHPEGPGEPQEWLVKNHGEKNAINDETSWIQNWFMGYNGEGWLIVMGLVYDQILVSEYVIPPRVYYQNITNIQTIESPCPHLIFVHHYSLLSSHLIVDLKPSNIRLRFVLSCCLWLLTASC